MSNMHSENDMIRRPLRVLHLGSPSGLYGAERWILALAKYLPPGRIQSTVGVIQDDAENSLSALCEHAARQGLPVIQFHAPGRMNLKAIQKLRAWLEQENIDVLHTHGYKTDIVGLFAVRKTSCKIISTPHGWSTEDGTMLQVYEILDRLAFAFMDAVVPLSSELLAGLQAWPIPADKLQLITNGVDIDDVRETVAAVRAETPVSPKKFNVGFIGRLVPQKGVETLLRGFSQADIPGKFLHLVGEGPQRPELEKLAAELMITDRVRFYGYRDDRLALLSAFNVFALCSAREGCPRALLEAMASGVPIVASDVPGCRDLVEHEVNGILFPYENVRALARSLERLAIDNSLTVRLVSTAEKYVESNFSARSMADRYTRLYEGLIARPASPQRAMRLPGSDPR